jgi:hypothetical protein
MSAAPRAFRPQNGRVSAASRVFRLACHAAVIAWGAALFAASIFETPVLANAAEAEEVVARIRPVPEAAREEPPPAEVARAEPPPRAEPPAEPEPEPEPSAEPPAESEPARPAAPTQVAARDISQGVALLGDGGVFPVLSCSYESFPSFRAYARAMASLGARFVVVRRRQIVGSINLETGTIGDAALGTAFSPRARDYTGEPGLAQLARRARARFGQGAVVMMLVPREIDAGLFGGIARLLAERGDRHDAYREIRGRYEHANGGVRLRVDAGIRPDGTRVAMDLLFDLGAIARARAAAA